MNLVIKDVTISLTSVANNYVQFYTWIKSLLMAEWKNLFLL